MAKKALILTPSLGFGGLIRQVLEDTGDFDVNVAARQHAPEGLTLAVLDADLAETGLAEFVAELRSHSPGIHLIVIPAESRPDDPQLDLLGADAILPSPFYLPDLVKAIENLYGPLIAKAESRRASYGTPTNVNIPEHEVAQAPEWLQDVSQAARYLTSLSLESASQAALITRGKEVWAYAGELPKRAAEELADAVAEHLAAGNEADLARFIRLDATRGDHMLYATSLGGEFGLALVFDAQVPFSQMRTQVNQIAAALATAPEQAIAENGQMHIAATKNGEPQSQPEHRVAEQALPSLPRSPQPPTINRVVTPTGRLEPLSAGGYDLHYAYVLIPRLPAHRLEGDLAEKIALWLPQLCLAFGWRLENISVQPEFVQWMVSMSPETSPEYVAQTLDKHLSERIFEEFPRLGKENPSSQFWAPGFLIVSGALPNATLVNEYIQQTRARQGVPR